MTSSEETFIKSKSEFKNHKSPSLVSNRADYEEREDWEESKSVTVMKKLYSMDRISLEMTNTKSDLQNMKYNEKVDKGSKILRSSSTVLEKENVPMEYDEFKRSISRDQWFGKGGSELKSDGPRIKKFAIGKFIEENPKSADLKWSLFCAACHSYRYDYVLRPFPPMFMKDDVKDIDRLRDVAESCPSMNVLHKQILDKASDVLSLDLVNLLYWVLIHLKDPQLRLVPKEKHALLLAKVGSISPTTEPQFIFQVVNRKISEQQKFNEYSKSYKTIYAFHGSRLDNFYSILNYGLRISFNKLSSNGPGIYLSSEMSVSLSYSNTGFSWGGSFFGSQISVLALCELVDHPDIKYSDGKKNKSDSFVEELETLSQKYFVVTNGDLIRVKYLLLFSNSIPEPSRIQLSATSTWLQRHKVFAVVLAYVFLLLAIATSNNSTAYKFYRRIMRRFGFKA